MKKAIYIFGLLVILATGIAPAQIDWQVRPVKGKYDDMQFLTADLIKVKKDKHCGIIDTEGNEILPIKYDSIFPMRGGVAIATIFKNPHWYVAGTVDNKGVARQFEPKYTFYYEQYPFYSEGYLVVVNATSGKKGYLDVTGNLLGGQLAFDQAYPFSEEKAMVKVNNQQFYIDRYCKSYSPVYKGVPYDACSNFYNGEAVVEDEYGEKFLTDNTFQTLRPLKRGFTPDYMMRYISGGEALAMCPIDPINTNAHPNASTLVALEGRYGYQQGKTYTIYPQFTAATPFVGSLALVKAINGGWGVLSCAKGKTLGDFEVKTTDNPVYCQQGKSTLMFLHETVPSNYTHAVSTVISNGFMEDTIALSKLGDGSYAFRYKPEQSGTKTVCYMCIGNDLILNCKQLSYQCQMVKPMTYDITVGKATEQNTHSIPVTVTVHNPNSVELNMPYALKGSAGFAGNTERNGIRIPAGGSKTITGIFKFNSTVNDAWVRLEDEGGVLAERKGFTLHPYIPPVIITEDKKKDNGTEQRTLKIITDKDKKGTPVIRTDR